MQGDLSGGEPPGLKGRGRWQYIRQKPLVQGSVEASGARGVGGGGAGGRGGHRASSTLDNCYKINSIIR